MKPSKVVTVGIVMVAIFFWWFNTVHAGPSLWPNSKGEICFNNVGPGPGAGEFVRMAVMRTVGNHYIIHGFVTEGPGKNNSLFNGNAIVDGNKIMMHFSSSGYVGNVNNNVEQVYGSIGRVELNTSDLKGWVLSIGFHCESSASCDFSYDVIQYLEPTPCP